MAITPNDNFIVGQVLTAAECNQFPRGVMAYGQSTTDITLPAMTETTAITLSAFTAVANRYYRITFFQPSLDSIAAGYVTMKIKNGATVLNTSHAALYNGTDDYEGICVAVTTFTAGSITITGTLTATALGSTNNTATQYGILLVEDIGTA